MFSISSFFKKKSPANSPTPLNSAKDNGLAGVTFYVMPRQFTSASVSGKPGAKKWGLLIFGAGGVVFLASAATLVWYIFFAPLKTPVGVSTSDVTVPTDQKQPVATDTTPAADATPEIEPESTAAEDDLSEKDCGIAELNAAGESAA